MVLGFWKNKNKDYRRGTKDPKSKAKDQIKELSNSPNTMTINYSFDPGRKK